MYKHWAGHFLPWAKPEKPDPNWADQDHNIQADVDMMVKSHFQNLRTKVAAPCLIPPPNTPPPTHKATA